MKVRLVRIAVCVVIVLLAILPVYAFHNPIEAASNITLMPSVQAAFPNSITFVINAQSSSVINRLRLHYVVERQNFAPVISESWPVFTPAASVDTRWVWDMRKSALPEGTKITYWWTATDANGNTAETEHLAYHFDDTQYDWKSITEGPVTLYWYEGDDNFANALMQAAQDGLAKIENDIGLYTEGTVRIYIYGSQSDLLSSQLFAPDWQGGVTFQGFDVIAIGVNPIQITFGLGATPHELTHWATGHYIYNPYGAGLPVWLEEGLATYVQNQDDSDWLAKAIRENKLISVRTLSSPFSAVAEQAYISYAESHSLINFMLAEYGKDKMAELLAVFHDGATYDAALQQVYGFDQDGLDERWRQSMGVE